VRKPLELCPVKTTDKTFIPAATSLAIRTKYILDQCLITPSSRRHKLGVGEVVTSGCADTTGAGLGGVTGCGGGVITTGAGLGGVTGCGGGVWGSVGSIFL
jgi:hypothetical protein